MNRYHEKVQGNNIEHRKLLLWFKRFAWLFAIWMLSVLALAVVALLIRKLMLAAGMSA